MDRIARGWGPHFPDVLGYPWSRFTSRMRTRVPIIMVEWGPGVSILGSPHFTLTPAPILYSLIPHPHLALQHTENPGDKSWYFKVAGK